MVVSSSSSSGRRLGVDRFYNPPAVRRQLELQRQQQRLQNTVNSMAPVVDKHVYEVREESDDSLKPSVSSSSSSSSNSPSPPPPPRATPAVANMDRFLEATTPVVPARYLSKTSKRGWRKYEGVELCPYFNLGDLWDSFKEWSAYGAGVPLVLNGGDCVVQYYVPFLSGIQLYLDDSRTKWRSRIPGDKFNGGMYQDAGSDASSESEADRAFRKRRDTSITSSHIDQDGLSHKENGVCGQTLVPVFEYLEHDPPYGREPLAEKISLLTNKFPHLKTYRSFDLHPSSWISVAWYPIYRIPTGPMLRDLDACFLTYHSLSTPLKYSCNGHSEVNGISSVKDFNNFTHQSAKLSLPVFGLASYKFKGSIWNSDNINERQLASSLLQAAENWLQHLNVDHPDFRFFLSHSSSNLH
ncbi:uncharacterized protein LOC110032469 [Phalaenopsis equestris]|uniref:uncharacterized protein LOC110032469 n=1 Tax=Phalaenopsis equestris TaxID=78828 RepID=UPI0009E40AA6|nr:uncharacterized protein LOC110032469 [Phalaenopsis equestris]